MTFEIRAARPDEAGLVHEFIVKLAAYENKRHEVVSSVADIQAALFGVSPRVHCDLLFAEGEARGFALWFYNFSTFHGKHGIYLEDLYVEPMVRGRGYGKALLKHLARRCEAEGLSRLQWWVLDWNAPSIAFYKSLGAEPQEEWTVHRPSGAALSALAQP